MSSPDADLLLYYREGCHLCEDMIQLILPVLQSRTDISYEFRNIDLNPEWKNKFHTRVPVLFYRQQLLSEYFLDLALLEQHLNGQQG